MRPMLPKIRKTRLPKRKASSNAVPRGLRSPRTCFFAPVSPHRSHAVVLHGYPRLSRCFLTLPCRFPAPFALFSHTAVPISHSVTHTCSYVPSRTVFSHRHALILRTVRARFLAPFPRGRSALVFGRRTFGLWLPRRAILHRYSRVFLLLRACSTDYAV